MASPRFAPLVLVGLALGSAACSAPPPASSSAPPEAALERTGAAAQASTSALDWSLVASGSLARSEYAMAHNPKTKQTVIFGGYTDSGEPTDDTLVWDGAAWKVLDIPPSARPPARSEAAMAYDPSTDRIILVGGMFDYYTTFNDVWAFDGSGWERVVDLPSPTGLTAAAMVGVADGLLLFGGNGDTGVRSGDTYSYANGKWALLSTPPGLTARVAHAMAYEPSSQSVVLYGGLDAEYASLADTWIFQKGAWTQGDSLSTMEGQSDHLMAAYGGKVYLFGPDDHAAGYVWDPVSKTWAEHSGLARRTYGERAVTTDGGVLLFGGPGGDGTYSTTGASWTTLKEPSLGNLGTLSMAYDPHTKMVVAMGRLQQGEGMGPAQLRGWSGTDWKTLALPAGSDEGNAYIASNGGAGLLMLAQSYEVPENAFSTYLWDGASWAKQVSNAPTERQSVVMAYDGVGVMLFGGYSYELGDLNDTWRWDGAKWEDVSPANAPPARERFGMAYDEVRKQVVLFGGWSGSEPLGDTWLWDGASKTWSEATPLAPLTPSARGDATMGYDGSLRRVVLYGGDDSAGGYDDVWTWDGAAWNEHSSGSAPRPMQDGGVMAYDPGRKLSVFAGSGMYGTRGGETWVLTGKTDGDCVTDDDCSSGMCVGGQCTSCGNGVIDDGELCDGEDLGGATCASLGQGAGTVSCTADCSGFELSLCACPGATANTNAAICQASVREANGCTYTSLPDGAACEGGECVAGVCVLDPEPPKPDFTTTTGAGAGTGGAGSAGAGGAGSSPTGGGAGSSVGSSGDDADEGSSCAVANPGAGESRGVAALGLAALGLVLAQRRRRSA